MMSSRDSARSTTKDRAERSMVRKREQEYNHQLKWGQQVEYYKRWEKNNNKFEEWTSPRYYETSNKKFQVQKDAEKRKDRLEVRREKLRKLISEEENSYSIELMVKNRNKLSSRGAEVPTEVLKDINVSLKVAEEDRRRHEAELALYHQWRNNHPILRDHERSVAKKNVKLAWLDQQIEKKRERERNEAECRMVLAERNKRMEEDKIKEELLKQEIAAKNQKLKEELEQQMAELQLAQTRSEELRKKEEEAERNLAGLFELEDGFREAQSRKMKREIDLENLKHHKIKLKQKAAAVKESLEYEQNLVKKLIASEAADRMEDEHKKDEIKRSMQEYLAFVHEQKELENKREKYFDFVFDSEAKMVCARQQELWNQEQKARDALLGDVFDTIKGQIKEKIDKTREKQKETIRDRENMIRSIEEYDQNIQFNNQEQKRKLNEWKKDIDEQIKEKIARKTKAKIDEEKKLELQVDMARKEEQRLRNEIAKLQQRQVPIKQIRNQIIF